MSVEDKQTLRHMEREFYRRQYLDLSDARFAVTRGVGYVGGVIRPSAGAMASVKEELKAVEENVRKIPGLHDLVIDAKIEEGSRR